MRTAVSAQVEYFNIRAHTHTVFQCCFSVTSSICICSRRGHEHTRSSTPVWSILRRWVRLQYSASGGDVLSGPSGPGWDSLRGQWLPTGWHVCQPGPRHREQPTVQPHWLPGPPELSPAFEQPGSQLQHHRYKPESHGSWPASHYFIHWPVLQPRTSTRPAGHFLTSGQNWRRLVKSSVDASKSRDVERAPHFH